MKLTHMTSVLPYKFKIMIHNDPEICLKDILYFKCELLSDEPWLTCRKPIARNNFGLLCDQMNETNLPTFVTSI